MAASRGLVDTLVSDLRDEGDDLDLLVSQLERHQWRRPTPAQGWTIAHQIAHLAWTDAQALFAANDPDAFRASVVALGDKVTAIVDEAADRGASEAPEELLQRWRAGRIALIAVIRKAPDRARIPWYGPSMSAASLATARLMETWAHGLDVADALGAPRSVSHRLQHVAYLGIRTRDFAFSVHGLPAPTEQFRIELDGPSGDRWTWGPADAGQRVTGSALDFCLLVTQRAHRSELDVAATGTDADRWLDIAQAFAGPPGAGRGALPGDEPP